MYAVGKLGSYISRGVYTVSGPFHPFGGAVDIVVVEQPDGTFKSSPWYVRFGKFQGVLKASEKVVSINVNGVDADFNMFLDHKGEAFFLREVEAEEGELEHYATSGDEKDVNAELWKVRKCKSYNFDSNRSDLVSELELGGKIPPKNNSRRGRLFGLSFGRRSMKENNGFQGREGGPVVDRATSMERAELAADLLEVRWTTNMKTGQAKLPPSKADFEVVNKVKAEGVNKNDIFVSGDDTDKVYSSVSSGDAEIPTSTNPLNNVGMLSMEETYMKVNISSDASYNGITNGGDNARSELSEVSNSDAMLLQKENNHETEGSALCTDELSDGGENTFCSTVDGPLAGEFGTSALCNPHEPLVEDVSVKSKVDEEVSSSDPVSLPPVSDLETSSANVQKASPTLKAEECSGDSAFNRDSSLSLLNDSEEEQFSFSDLDDQKVDKDGCKKRRPQDSLESSEDEVSETDVSDDKSHQVICKLNQPSPNENSNRMSSPITISKQDKDTDEQALTSVAAAMPNMLIDVDGVSAYGGPERLGHSLDSNLEAIKMVNDVLVASEGNAAKQQIESVQLETNSPKISDDIKKIMSDPAVEISLCRHLLSEGMGYEAAAVAFDTEKMDADEFSSLCPEIVKNEKLVVRIGGLYFPWDAALPIASAIGSQEMEKLLEPTGMIAVGQADDKTSEEATQKSENSGSGTWKIWPFLFKRSNSMQCKGVDSESAPETPSVMVDDMDATRPKPSKRKIRSKAPTSEQLASLKLKDGKNEVMFTFSTAMLGKQQVDARIFLWKWNHRIVISDVDGTITKSDVLGQFMPLMGMDWSQMGVTHLFSAIKENGYQLLFLSARSISQASTTRQFLCNLKQDGKELPEGPVIISPDGLFPSLYREVIRRAPHEFKIACLEDIKVLFPTDHSPFYAGFGNRDTDEISYLRVGIPIGKIFIINPKGQIAVNRRVDTKSYTSLHSLVHGMFPSAPPAEQEDYNSWNFWRLPPPDVI